MSQDQPPAPEPKVQKTQKTTEKAKKPAKVKVRRPPGHPLVHFLLLVGCSAASAQGFFPTPGYQIGFLGYVLVLGYFYPLLLRWLRPKTGFLFGLILLLLIAAVSETVGIVVYENQATGLVFRQGFQDEVLLSPVVLVSFVGVLLSAITTYLLGWCMLQICIKVFGKRMPRPVEPEPEDELASDEETAHEAGAEPVSEVLLAKPEPAGFKFE